MSAQQFEDLPQIQYRDETRSSVWVSGFDGYSFPEKQCATSFNVVDDMYFHNLDDSIVSMQPMQRFMFDTSPLSSGLLHANMPLQSWHCTSQWPSNDYYRNVSPDRTSVSATSSYASQNEASSPHPYNTISYGNHADFCQPSLPYHTTEQFDGVSYVSGTSGANISLKDIEYAHQEPEPITEDSDSINIKQEPIVISPPVSIKMESTPNTYTEYADSGIRNSVRDAESVQPVDFKDVSEVDSDYSPTYRPGKRRRSAPYTARASRRRNSARKDSVASSPSSNKPSRRPRGATRVAVESQYQDDPRPFPCPLAAYNCTSTFASKNEWKRHVSTQHIKLGYWRCDICTPTTDPNDVSVLYHNDFNRKDLFTQHLRRMHTANGSGARHMEEHPVNDDNIQEHQTRCYLRLRCAPKQSICPFPDCDREFAGPASWEQRMDHVGRHLEKDRKNGTDRLDVASWKIDTALEHYLMDEGLITWEDDMWQIGDGKARRPIDGHSSDED